MPQLTPTELANIERMQRAKQPGVKIFKALQKARAKKKQKGPGKTAVYEFLAGNTHLQHADETRGRKKEVTAKVVDILDKHRRKLQQEVSSEYIVTWDDIVRAAGKELRQKGLWGKRKKLFATSTAAKELRKRNVTKRPSRAHLARTRDEEARRLRKAQTWKVRPATFWVEDVTYIDNKKWLAPLTDEQRKRQRQAVVTHHLRTPQEGKEAAYIVPKTKHNRPSGVPSFEVTAAVAKDRIIMWREAPGPWGGKAAAAMYKDLGKSLRRTRPGDSSFRLVEDGDPKGYQSNLGKNAKKEQGIVSWKLPPRTPQLMPLDFCLWHEIERRVLQEKKKGKESIANYKARVKRVALSLPKSIVKACLLSMKQRMKNIVDADGGYTKKE
jgi:hypothetical protein